MYKYTAKELISRALALADLKNSAFLSWGEQFHYINQAYREVYQDIINIQDTAYLKKVALLSVGDATFDLPDDFYQLAAITDGRGNEIPRRRLEHGEEAYGYSIENGQLHVKAAGNPLTLIYYPLPDTITYKSEDIPINIPATPISGFGNNILLSDGRIYNIKTSSYTKSSTSSISSTAVLGAYTYISNNVEYDFAGNVVTSSGPFLLLEDGSFIQKSDSFTFGAANKDNSAVFYIDNNTLYYSKYNGIEYETSVVLDTYDGSPFRYIYWNGKDAIINNSMIIYYDGVTETTDVHGSNITLVKTDIETGYGYLVKKGNQYVLTGFTPDTLIDYPNNVLFDLTAYSLAIQYRVKQNSDSSALTSSYLELKKSYTASLSQDGSSYPTIRNVKSRITNWFVY